MTLASIIIVGGPRSGKSTIAEKYRSNGYHVRCGDPASAVKNYIPGVEYLPEGLDFSGDQGAAQWVVDHWFGAASAAALPGHRPWIAEGHVMARALRRWAQNQPLEQQPAERIIVLTGDPRVETSKGQDAMRKAVMTVWWDVSPRYEGITEYRDYDARTGRVSCTPSTAAVTIRPFLRELATVRKVKR